MQSTLLLQFKNSFFSRDLELLQVGFAFSSANVTSLNTEQSLTYVVFYHRAVEVGRKLWRSSSSTPLPRQSLLKQITPECVQVDFAERNTP